MSILRDPTDFAPRDHLGRELANGVIHKAEVLLTATLFHDTDRSEFRCQLAFEQPRAEFGAQTCSFALLAQRKVEGGQEGSRHTSTLIPALSNKHKLGGTDLAHHFFVDGVDGDLVDETHVNALRTQSVDSIQRSIELCPWSAGSKR